MQRGLTAAPATSAEVFRRARLEGRRTLLDPEGFTLLREMGLAVPAHLFVEDAAALGRTDLEALPGEEVFLKAACPDVPHKTDAGGLARLPKEPATIADAAAEMEQRLSGHRLSGFTLHEAVRHDPSLGGELLVGLRWSDELGPVVTVGPGGVEAEVLSRSLSAGRATAVFSPALDRGRSLVPRLERCLVAALAAGLGRGRRVSIALADLEAVVQRFLAAADAWMPSELAELEVNPLVGTPRGPVALDVLARLAGEESEAPYPPRPRSKINRLLEPRSMAVVGVSAGMNPGRQLLQNTLAAGFPPRAVTVVKPGREEIDGVRCVPDLASLPAPVDLLIVAVDAAQVPAVVEEVVATAAAESLLLIPGGLGESPGSAEREARVRAALAASRSSGQGGPVANGGNCLGIVSAAGRYDTTFIPPWKLPPTAGPAAPLAILAQSGAFAVSRASRLTGLRPRLLISLGNQSDLTLGDYLDHLAEDSEIAVFACYVEGLRPGDGLAVLPAVRRITASGRNVVVYRAGRTPAGTRATASHTAAVAGDWTVARELLAEAGALVAETLEDFDDLVRLATLLRNRPPGGARLGALSNAGFESVAIADSLGPFTLARLAPETEARLGDLLDSSHLGGVVPVANPLDVTPILSDEAFALAAEAILADPGVDVGLVGCVPLTAALTTLAAGPGHGEDAAAQGSVGPRLARLFADVEKPWAAVVDAGPLYDPLTHLLEAAGVPTFRSADRALRALATWVRTRLPPPAEGAGRG